VASLVDWGMDLSPMMRYRGGKRIDVSGGLITLRLVVALLSFAVSCTQTSQRERDTGFYQLLDATSRTGLGLSIVNVERLGGSVEVVLMVWNDTSEPIVFPPGFGVRAFRFDDAAEEWIELPDATTRYGARPVELLPAGEAPFDRGVVHIAPDIAGLKYPLELRVAVKGTFSLEDEGEGNGVVVEFIDVPIPQP